MTCQSYPPMSDDAHTFEELFNAYLLQVSSIDPNLHTERLFRQVQAIAKEFPAVDIWDYLDSALQHTINWHDPKKGRFDKLFERNLRERLRKASARNAEEETRRAQGERRYAEESRQRRSEHDAQAVAFERWSRYLLDAVTLRLDYQARVYLDMRRDGTAVRDIAETLNVSEESLGNKYGGKKLVMRVRREICRMVLDLTDHQRGLLIRHLLDEAGLTIGQVEHLLRIPVQLVSCVPVLEEEAILGSLGWLEKISENNWSNSANPAFEREYIL